jgi:hypothetical protein
LESVARTQDINIKAGTLTINEARSRAGLPLIEAQEADMPILVAGQGAYFITENGIQPLENPLSGLSLDSLGSEPTPELPTEEKDDTDAVKTATELKKFLRFLKQNPEREFNFREVPVVYAEVLNKFVAVKDFDSARWYAERYLA